MKLEITNPCQKSSSIIHVTMTFVACSFKLFSCINKHEVFCENFCKNYIEAVNMSIRGRYTTSLCLLKIRHLSLQILVFSERKTFSGELQWSERNLLWSELQWSERNLSPAILQKCGINNWLFTQSWRLLLKAQFLQSKIWRDGAFRSHLGTRLVTVTDGHVVLIIVLQMQTRRQLTPATKRQIWHG